MSEVVDSCPPNRVRTTARRECCFLRGPKSMKGDILNVNSIVFTVTPLGKLYFHLLQASNSRAMRTESRSEEGGRWGDGPSRRDLFYSLSERCQMCKLGIHQQQR